MIGAGSFGTALAVLLARGGLRTTLQARTAEQAAQLEEERENRVYLPGVELPAQLRIEPASAGVARADYVFLAVPSQRAGRGDRGAAARPASGARTAVVSVAKGLVPPDGLPPTTRAQRARSAPHRVACLGGPAHAQEMVHAGAALVAASSDEELARSLAQVFTRAGVVCEQSNDPLGVELAGAAKNAAALAAGATEAQGLNAAGAAAGHIFAEVWRYAEGLGRAAGVDDRPGRRRRPRGHGARAREPQPPRRRAARRRRARRGDPRAASARRSRRSSRCRCWRARSSAPGATVGSEGAGGKGDRAAGAGDDGPRPADLRRAAAGGVGRAGARHRPAAARAGAAARSRASGGGMWRRVWRPEKRAGIIDS